MAKQKRANTTQLAGPAALDLGILHCLQQYSSATRPLSLFGNDAPALYL